MTAKRRACLCLRVCRRWFPVITRLICRRWKRLRQWVTRWFGIWSCIGPSANQQFLTHLSRGLAKKTSRRQGRQRFGQYQRSTSYVFRRRVLVGTMTVSVAARNEQHRHRSDARHEKRIVIGAADHRKKAKTVLAARFGKGFDDFGSAPGGSVGVQQ